MIVHIPLRSRSHLQLSGMSSQTYSFFLVCSTSLIQSNETLPFSALFVFGDSTVDAGNNDYLVTITKCNFPPYGRDFIDHKATGRFCNGKLTTDFIVEALGLKETMPPYLDPALSAQDIVTGVTFASGGSGYDNLTADLTSVLPVWKQIQLFKSYRKRLTEIVGYKNASDIIRNALFVCSMGTNDFVFTYSAQPIRRAHMNVEQYQDFLLQGANGLIQELYKEGARSLAFVGIPPMGCLPLVRTLNLKQNINKRIGKTECLEEQNQVAVSYNGKLQSLLQNSMHILPDVKLVYVDIYNVLYDMIQNPEKHGFEVTDEGCCGTGLIEAGPLCNKNTPIICSDASKYVFWDSIHPTEKAYEIVAQEVVDRDLQQFFF